MRSPRFEIVRLAAHPPHATAKASIPVGTKWRSGRDWDETATVAALSARSWQG
jgi:hypothetical protein